MTAEQEYRYLQSRQAPRDAQRYLSQFKRREAQVHQKVAQLEVIREKQRAARAAQGGKIDWRHPLVDIIALEDDVLEDYDALIDLREEIVARLERVPDPIQRKVLEKRYLAGAPFFQIAMDLYYDERQVYRLHRAALRHIAAQLLQDMRKG